MGVEIEAHVPPYNVEYGTVITMLVLVVLCIYEVAFNVYIQE